ncbi:CDP-glycerol glycerophosphotransferase family protein [Tetragenococcus halophilus]|uniref:CDP-glycerol glycerophosphotransferase family protein n=1 Tax=Tetragenococcus halophilus TaxID=51669 RepID=UPI000CC36E46|nr:CDP-glycerol glycerophosphotransferase family protein [Tetragenococcus halophilus]MCO7027546.1 CDP-glycerol glycerophosphotransferase family protein [Tetragenococcus halophilus]GBD59671.1 hypothetical protein TEHN0098T_1667 [Tetragenococcus halophilus subsp. halophilus]GMA43642.1 CDP-glycerol glycerophosphotransferase [Tetragenococcus halophilus subsp. halophilus DSM 20339]
MLSKVKRILRRKFELYDLKLNKENLVMQFKLDNFIIFNNKDFYLKLNGSNISYSFKKISQNIVEAQVDTRFLNNNNTFDFYYKSKKLWLVMSKEVDDVFEINDRIYIGKVDKSLMLNKYKTDYNLFGQWENASIRQLNEEYISFEFETNLDSIILLNSTRQIEIPVFNNKMSLSKIQTEVEDQQYYVYLVFDGKMYSSHFVNRDETYYLMMNYEWLNNRLFISTSHYEVPSLKVSSMLNEVSLNINVKIEDKLFDNNYQFSSFAIIDSDLTNLEYLPSTDVKGNLNGSLIIDTFETLNKKKLLMVFYNTLKGNKIYCLLDSKNKVNITDYYSFEGQIYQLNLKKENGITITSTKPKFRAGVNAVNDQVLSIYFEPSKIYERFQYYLTFEERASQNSYHIAIERGERDIEIPYDKLETLKTLPKNVVDIFISIFDNQDLIRKEKIKFKEEVYKKDSYLTLRKKEINDKKVYYMFTLTPFKNIKVESFEITDKQYQILENGKKSDKIWLIGERTDTAQDNGIQLFKWLQDNTDVEVYYVIDELSEDFKRIKHLQNIIIFGSQKHYEVAAKANVLISTHDLENILPYKTARGFWGYENTVKIFLQHGVLGRKNVEYHKQYYDLPFHLFDVTSNSEKYKIVVNQLGYQPKDVAVTGLPRFDNLPLNPDKKVKKILIMPTWRDWLNSDYAFNNSEYMQQYLNLINDKELETLLDKYNVEVNFYPHYRAQEFFKYHLDNVPGRIQYIELGEKTVQELLIEHDLLITDYSSISFDFSYMNKPVIFFHFDVERFFRKGILRPIEETFIGKIAYNRTELINNIEEIIKTNDIIQNVDGPSLFEHIDHKNSERVYKAILSKIDEVQGS